MLLWCMLSGDECPQSVCSIIDHWQRHAAHVLTTVPPLSWMRSAMNVLIWGWKSAYTVTVMVKVDSCQGLTGVLSASVCVCMCVCPRNECVCVCVQGMSVCVCVCVVNLKPGWGDKVMCTLLRLKAWTVRVDTCENLLRVDLCRQV